MGRWFWPRLVVGSGIVWLLVVALWWLVLVVASFSCWLWPYAVVGCNHRQMYCGVVGCGLVRLLVVATSVVGHSGPKLAIVYWRPGQLALEPKMQPHKEVDEVFSGSGFGQDIMINVYGLCC